MKLKHSFLIVSVLVLSACSGVQSKVLAPNPANRPTASINCENHNHLAAVYTLKSQSVGKTNYDLQSEYVGGNTEAIDLPAGKYRLDIRFEKKMPTWASVMIGVFTGFYYFDGGRTSNINLDVTVEPGKTYVVRSQRGEDKSLHYFWIEESTSGKLVAGGKPPHATNADA